MLRWICGLGALALVSCGGPDPGLDVKVFHLRDPGEVKEKNEVIRGEQLKRLYGAVSLEERRERLGLYYTVRWNGPAGREQDPVKIVFDYRQAATGAKILTMTEERPGTAQGKVEFAVTGEAYRERGRVLAAKV